MVTFCKLQKGMAIGGHYEIVKFLGRGSMGEVYQTRDQYFEDYNRIVACKILPKELRQTPGREQYFKREFLAAQELVHQNICCTYEFGEDEDLETYYLIMEYVEGDTLRTLINKSEYTLEQVLPLIQQIAMALDFAHQKGILHLDMKPDNIIVRGGGHVKIMDFGLARVIGQSMTHISLMDVEGTPLYMAPEQIDPKSARKRVDYAVDRWALGVMVYEILAGYPPFDGRMGITPLIYSILNADPEPLDLPPGAWATIARMLSKDPKERYATCLGFYHDLANPSISATTYIPLGENGRFEKTRRKGIFPSTSVLPLDSSEQPEASTDTDFALQKEQSLEEEATPVSPGNAPARSSVVSLGEAPDEFPTDSLQGIECEQDKDQQDPTTSEKSVVHSRLPRKDDLPSFVWNEVAPHYPNAIDIQKAQRARGFKFFTVNNYKYLVYRHLQTGSDFILIPSGEFWMGSAEEGKDNERPSHKVYLDAYLMAVKPIAQEVWQKIMNHNPSFFNRQGNYPVEQISYNDLCEFCEKTSLEIPTEAQWEKACRSGTRTIYYWGDQIEGDYLWYVANSGRSTQPVGTKKPNNFGIYDICGNVWEWCRDDYSETAYQFHSKKNPFYQDSKSDKKVRRGGSWLNRPEGCRCAIRQADPPDCRARGLGGRVSLSL